VDPVISDLLTQYENGRLSRRELVTGLSALAATAAAGPAFGQAATPAPLKPSNIDHVSILVADLERSKAFYRRVFGLVSVSEDAPNKIVRLAPEGAPPGVGSIMVSLRQAQPYGTTDHWCFKLPGFNTERVTENLKAHGLTPDRNVEYGFYIKDPDGVVVQMF
jgi:catechol 2,3-dioxygenase-like lactoylglutathione lyase family enzyme